MMPESPSFDGGDIQPGTYFVEITQGEHRTVQKLISYNEGVCLNLSNLKPHMPQGGHLLPPLINIISSCFLLPGPGRNSIQDLYPVQVFVLDIIRVAVLFSLQYGLETVFGKYL